MKKIAIISCSRNKKERTRLYKSTKDFSQEEFKVIFHENNNTGLPKTYNKYLTKDVLKYHDILLFIHDDVYIDDPRLFEKLYNGAKYYDIIGLAGCLNPEITIPSLWHRMANNKDWRGYVFHRLSNKEPDKNELPDLIRCDSFGPTPSRVSIMDGLFMAVVVQKALDANWIFNESFDFHHYDIASCLDACERGLTLGVMPIHVIHDSLGLSDPNDIHFKESEDRFMKLYS